MQEIAAYTGRDRATVMNDGSRKRISRRRRCDGRWESNTELIDEYRHRRIEKAGSGGGSR